MTTFATTGPVLCTDGMPYSTSFLVPTTNADNDLYNQSPAVPPNASPIPVIFESLITAEIAMVVAGSPGTNTSWFILQTDFGDNNWFDLAWILCSTQTTNGTYLFLLSNGLPTNQAVAQTRTAGTAPSSTGSVAAPLGGRIRFIGRSVTSGGTSPTITVTIKYKLQGLR